VLAVDKQITDEQRVTLLAIIQNITTIQRFLYKNSSFVQRSWEFAELIFFDWSDIIALDVDLLVILVINVAYNRDIQ